MLAQCVQRVAEIVVRRRVLGLQAQRLAERVGGIFVAPGCRIRIAEVVVRHRKGRRERQRIAKPFDCVVQLTHRLQRVTKVQLQRGVVRAQIRGAAHEVGRFRVLALLVAQHAQQMQRIDMYGIGVERRAVTALGVGEAAVKMCRVRAVERRFHDGRGRIG